YAYDARNQLRFTVDALGYVVENRYDAQGQLVSSLQHARAINPNSATTEQDIVTALTYQTMWSNDLSSLSGLTISGSSASVSNENGRLVFTNTAGADTWPSMMSTATYPFQAGLLFRGEVTTGSPLTERFLFGIENTGSGTAYRRHTLDICDGYLCASVGNASGITRPTLGAAKTNTTYVVEIETTATGTVLFVYEKGKDRASGWVSRLDATGWGDIRIRAYTWQYPTLTGTKAYLDNLSVSKQIPAADSSANTTRSVYSKDGRLRFSIDAAGYVTENKYDANGRI
ncbi:hypothetical protein, partial [Chitiniphilus shinanonensis]|uniref:hypothetical protein n=1 Tax=Chitiniphilus shinanonensis TaxID=553088 RepID=UPI0024E05AA9